MRKFQLGISIIFILILGAFSPAMYGQTASVQSRGAAQSSQPAPAAKPLEQMVAMRDGVKLSTSIYLPEGSGPWPVVLIRTPYGKGTQAINNNVWAGRGFALVVQDCRGTFKSEGAYHP